MPSFISHLLSSLSLAINVFSVFPSYFVSRSFRRCSLVLPDSSLLFSLHFHNNIKLELAKKLSHSAEWKLSGWNLSGYVLAIFYTLAKSSYVSTKQINSILSVLYLLVCILSERKILIYIYCILCAAMLAIDRSLISKIGPSSQN